jgi:hypothetical protein
VNPKRLFTPEEHSRIDAAIAEIERSTAADLRVVVTRVSDRYSLYPVAWAAVGAILIGVIVSLFRPEIASRTVIVIQLWALITMTLLLEWLPIRLAIVPERVKHAHARQLAHREFNAHVAEAKPHGSCERGSGRRWRPRRRHGLWRHPEDSPSCVERKSRLNSQSSAEGGGHPESSVGVGWEVDYTNDRVEVERAIKVRK